MKNYIAIILAFLIFGCGSKEDNRIMQDGDVVKADTYEKLAIKIADEIVKIKHLPNTVCFGRIIVRTNGDDISTEVFYNAIGNELQKRGKQIVIGVDNENNIPFVVNGDWNMASSTKDKEGNNIVEYQICMKINNGNNINILNVQYLELRYRQDKRKF